MKQRFAEFLQRTDGKQDMVDDFVSWREWDVEDVEAVSRVELFNKARFPICRSKTGQSIGQIQDRQWKPCCFEFYSQGSQGGRGIVNAQPFFCDVKGGHMAKL